MNQETSCGKTTREKSAVRDAAGITVAPRYSPNERAWYGESVAAITKCRIIENALKPQTMMARASGDSFENCLFTRPATAPVAAQMNIFTPKKSSAKISSTHPATRPTSRPTFVP